MTDSKFVRLLGLCAAAGKVVSGADAVTVSVRKGRARLVVLDSQSAPDTQKKAVALAKSGGVPLVLSDIDVGKTVGHEGRVIAAVTDAGFAKALMRYHAIVEC